MQIVTFERRAGGGDRELADTTSMGATALGFEALESVRHGARRLGAILPSGSQAGAIADLNRALAVKLASDDAGAPEAEADSLLPTDMRLFLSHLPRSLEAARSALEFVLDALDRYDAPDLERAGIVQTRKRVRLCAPVPRPGKIIGVGKNFRDHAAEVGADDQRPDEPHLFLKAPSAVIGPEDEIRLPTEAKNIDYEGELAVVIGRPALRVAVDDALDFVAGYCVGNDVCARDLQKRGQRSLSKSCDTFAPLGPALVTSDEIPDPQDLGIRTTVSGEMRQSGRTKDMYFSVAEVISFASGLMCLDPGDIILMGTPAGVGSARNPPLWLADGDTVAVEIERVGRLVNPVRGPR